MSYSERIHNVLPFYNSKHDNRRRLLFNGNSYILFSLWRLLLFKHLAGYYCRQGIHNCTKVDIAGEHMTFQQKDRKKDQIFSYSQNFCYFYDKRCISQCFFTDKSAYLVYFYLSRALFLNFILIKLSPKNQILQVLYSPFSSLALTNQF